MQFDQPLIAGRLIKRYKRFLADVVLDTGEVVTAHCPNTGAMTHCQGEGWRVWLSKSANPKRKLAYTWELAVNSDGHFIGVNTQRANALVDEALDNKKLSSLECYPNWRREVKYGCENSKIDFLLSADELADCYLEVKSVTLLDGDCGYFPDAKTVRGQKHLRELIQMIDSGHRSVIVFCSQHTGIQSIRPAHHIDPVYAELCKTAAKHGVQFIGLGIHCDAEKIYVTREIPIIL